jgi:anti-sigma factor RsiW
MRCTQAKKLLSAYQDGALSEPQRTRVREHLAQCPGCAALASELQRAWDLLGLSEAADTSSGFVAGVMRRVQAPLPQPVWQAPRWAVAAALAVCLGCGGLVGYLHSNPPGVGESVHVTLAADVSQQLGVEAFAPSPADTLAGAYVQFTGSERER